MLDLPIEEKELTKPKSFTLRPSTIDLIEEYAGLKNTNASRVVETLARHFLPKIITEELRRQQS